MGRGGILKRYSFFVICNFFGAGPFLAFLATFLVIFVQCCIIMMHASYPVVIITLYCSLELRALSAQTIIQVCVQIPLPEANCGL